MLVVRNLLFYLGYWATLPFFSLLGLAIWPVTSFRLRSRFVTLWNRFVVCWLRITCGVRYELKGLENLPTKPSVILSNHQSAWETLTLQYLFSPASTVLKRELLNIPVFGWGLRAMQPIAIDRKNPREALKAVKHDGLARLAAGNHVLIFPEGTRKAPGKLGSFARSGADIACAGEYDIIPVAHDAGICWPARRWLKRPGKITLIVGPAITTQGKNSKAVTEQARTWIASQLEQQPTVAGD
ncbi:1-acyl-sn-glycerol-3-phosphate acyltransferase [Simiduia sp. 21SJ11W-1]|uniref:lysophospholipid acyltransferase family protein n=1 Tax=Simiduia sp. 21SJ11W-1 TaxID=2909669 RepID=UPI00209E7D88|nr:lysophospholipid acyltransferase family protein [Simiduia sp. 21SJ11W-1]UTA47930.1 1-acyl-sn-glycerol-3-phosphate acyltransferase [Simiduia sp. 21SJ11W-1]